MSTVLERVPVVQETLRTARPATRNVAVDAYRGFVMLLMMAEVLRLSQVSEAFPRSWFWKVLAYNQTHVEWAGCSLHDLIQPSFSFLVGVALPYSIASRLAKGVTFGKLLAPAAWRSLALIALGIFLRSMHTPQTHFTFEDTLTQIGLGYTFLFLLGFCSPRWQWTALAVILVGYWLAWALYHSPGAAHPDEAVVAGWSGGRRRRLAAALHPHLPGGEAHLDAQLEAGERRRVLPASGRLQLGD